MRKPWVNLACFFLFLMAGPTLLIAQQPGQITLTGSVTSGSGSSVQIKLINCGQYNPRVLYDGSLQSVVVPQTYTATPDSSGSWSITVWPNDLLVCGGTTGATAYQVTYTQNGSPVSTPENFRVTSTGPNPYNTTTQPPLDTLPPAYALKTNFNFQSLTLGNSLNAQVGSFGSINTKSLLINGVPIAAQGQAVPNTGGTLTGTLSQNFSNYFNPQFTQNNSSAMIGNAHSYFWSGTVPGTSAYNYGQYVRSLNSDVLVNDTPGCAGFALSCYNTQSGIESYSEYVNSAGTANLIGVNDNHWGIGDTEFIWGNVTSFGGQVDGGGPEGMNGIRMYVTEPANTYTGTVATAGQGQTNLILKCTNDCGQSPYGFGTDPLHNGKPASVGQGLYVMDEQSPTASGQIESVQNGSGETPGTLTLNITSGVSNLAISTCYGTLGSAITPTPNPAGSGTQSVTFTITLSEGSGSCVAGEVASFSGFMHDQALVTAVGTASGGQQQITANLREYHEAGSYMFENPNSDAGLYADILADNVSGIQFPFDILGIKALSKNTAVMWYRWFYAGNTPGVDGLPLGNMVLSSVSATSLSNTGGTVTLHGGSINQNSPWINSHNIYISNASNSAFDGECTNASLIATTATITCTQSTSNGQTATSATITLTDASGTNPYGNSDVNFYQGAMIVNSQDTNASITVNGQTVYPVDGKLFQVEANEMPLDAGDMIVEGHSSAMKSHITEYDNSTLNPMAYTSDGIGINFDGEYQSGGLRFGGENTPLAINNQTPISDYSYFGGTQKAPLPIYLSGQWDGFATFYQAPDPYSYLLNVANCPASPSSCTDTGYWYGIYHLIGNGGYVDSEFIPDTNTLVLNGTRQFNNIGSDTSFKTNVGGDTFGIGFGGRTGAANQYVPLWKSTATAGDLPEIAQCNTSSECGLEDSGTPLSSIAQLNSPSFTGAPTAPTANAGTNNTQVATTSFVQSAISTASPAPVTLSLGVSAIAANSCSTVQTVAVIGATTSMIAVFSGHGVLASSVHGYGAGGLRIDASVTATNSVSVQVCNPTTASITPGALTLNVTAIQ